MSGLYKYLKPRTGSARWLWAGIILCALGAVYAAFELDRLASEARQTRQQIARLREAPRPKPRVTKIDEERNEQWAALSAERKFAWYPIFHALEQASNDDIELLEFRPDKVNGQLSLRGEARDMKALVAYLDAWPNSRLSVACI